MNERMENDLMLLIKLSTLFAMSNSDFTIYHALALIISMSIEILSRLFGLLFFHVKCPFWCFFSFFRSIISRNCFNRLERFGFDFKFQTKNVSFFVFMHGLGSKNHCQVQKKCVVLFQLFHKFSDAM